MHQLRDSRGLRRISAGSKLTRLTLILADVIVRWDVVTKKVSNSNSCRNHDRIVEFNHETPVILVFDNFFDLASEMLISIKSLEKFRHVFRVEG